MARHPSNAAEFPPEPPADPRPAWERIAYTWLEREVDAGQPVTADQLAHQTSVAPQFANDLLQVLRAQRQRDPGLAELRGRLVRDRISDLYLTRELRAGERLDPAQVAGELGTTTTVARQWLRALREVRARDPRLASLRATPESHGRVHADQLAALAERFAGAPAPTSPAPGWPLPADALTDQIELAWRHAQATGAPIDPAALARALRTTRQSVTNTLTALQAGTPTTRQRIEAAYRDREIERGEWVNLTDLAAELGTSPAYVKRVVGPLRAIHRASQRQPAPTTPAVPGAGPGEGRVWLDLAACRDTDPELFFAERGEQAKAHAAKQVCAACPVQGPCRDLAVTAAASRGDDHGIFGATKPHERTALRGNPVRGPSGWLTDRAAAEEAHQLAVELGPQQAAKQLGTHASTLRRAWARWGLDYPGRPRASEYARDPDKAREAFRLAEQLGSVKAAAGQLGSSRPALLAGWQRFGLGTPDLTRPTLTHPGARPAEQAGQLDAAFLALNQGVVPVRARSDGERFTRVRGAEQFATIGAEAVTQMATESRSARQGARVWAVTRRAERAQTLARQRDHRGERRHAERAGRADRDRRPHHRQTQEGREVAADGR
jgi:WhiB family redox-sensing transcriptional regulator